MSFLRPPLAYQTYMCKVTKPKGMAPRLASISSPTSISLSPSRAVFLPHSLAHPPALSISMSRCLARTRHSEGTKIWIPLSHSLCGKTLLERKEGRTKERKGTVMVMADHYGGTTFQIRDKNVTPLGSLHRNHGQEVAVLIVLKANWYEV